EGDVSRVIDAWTRLRAGREFEKNWEEYGLQQAGSYMEGLSATPWHDIAEYDWAKGLEDRAPEIIDELMAAGKRKDLPQKGTNVWAPAAREDAMAYGPDWRTLVLQDRSWDPTNMKLFPRTVEILRDELQVPSSEVFFARQAPKTGIKPHTDNTNFILTAHLGLAVPEGECWMQVGNERKEWRNGKMLIFDTSFVHSTGNEADVDRTVLLIRFWHPEVTTVERRALEFIFAAIENPALIETPSAERQM
ncbi:unnamed protein product, partial [Chrysoparadoxa australica]